MDFSYSYSYSYSFHPRISFNCNENVNLWTGDLWEMSTDSQQAQTPSGRDNK